MGQQASEIMPLNVSFVGKRSSWLDLHHFPCDRGVSASGPGRIVAKVSSELSSLPWQWSVKWACNKSGHWFRLKLEKPGKLHMILLGIGCAAIPHTHTHTHKIWDLMPFLLGGPVKPAVLEHQQRRFHSTILPVNKQSRCCAQNPKARTSALASHPIWQNLLLHHPILITSDFNDRRCYGQDENQLRGLLLQ